MQVSQEEEEEEQDDQQPQKHKQEQKLKPNLPADINVHIMNLNGLLNQLNQFLELQQQEQEKLQAWDTHWNFYIERFSEYQVKSSVYV